ncbi:hypothetical protein [Parablautia sp. Marseille-Q6255]|uniref:hypothetical protein n=1 Tax=Parablautia sp. Marseille-Q6255 TaxID=3039593 RepID=UPI0024BC65EE|nr:hypothetical protein [Parablautia sp. Marseille-Q6255]
MKQLLPDWITKETQTFFSWLTGKIQAYPGLRKTEIEKCTLIYGNFSFEQQGKMQEPNLYGVFRKTDDTLYEVNALLYHIAGISTVFSFPGKDDIQRKLECKVSAKGRIIIKNFWDELVISCGYTVKDLIPVIDREQILTAAEKYQKRGKRSLDIVYVPYFTFTSQKHLFSDAEFLQYLNYEDSYVDKTAWEWIKKDLPQISQKRIYYGCVREEMRRMESNMCKTGRIQGTQKIA